MTRPKSDIRISLKNRGGKTTRLNLTELLDGSWLIRRDGKKATAIPAATSTEVADKVRQWIVSQKRM